MVPRAAISRGATDPGCIDGLPPAAGADAHQNFHRGFARGGSAGPSGAAPSTSDSTILPPHGQNAVNATGAPCHRRENERR